MASTTIPDLPTPEQNERKSPKNIPAFLIREVVAGKAFCYPGFRSVLNKSKQLEEIMGDSGLQSLLKNLIGDVIKAQLDRTRFLTLVGETGSHLDQRNNLGLDIAIFDRQLLPPSKLTNKYVDVPPKVVLEIDVNVEMPEAGGNLFEQYILPKIRQLLLFGTERVIWYFTQSKTIILADAAEQWTFPKWDGDIEVMPGVVVNIARLMEGEGIGA